MDEEKSESYYDGAVTAPPEGTKEEDQVIDAPMAREDHLSQHGLSVVKTSFFLVGEVAGVGKIH